MDLEKKISLLLIEDNPADARILEELLLADYGGKYRITKTDRLDNVASLLTDQSFDVVITDLSLPDSRGQETVRRIQEMNGDIPVIVLSGEDSEELAMQIVQAGAQDYLVKGKGDGYLINRAIQYSIERKRIQDKLAYYAHYDSLTGLPNRTLFRERLGRALVRAARHDFIFALMFIDLDGFKEVNDALGHDMGDELLIEVGKRIKQCVRESDTVARLGGDEFTVILEEIHNRDDARTVAQKLIDALSSPIDLDGEQVRVSASIGITLYPADDVTEVNLLKKADTAMYRAKDLGRNQFQFYQSGM